MGDQTERGCGLSRTEPPFSDRRSSLYQAPQLQRLQTLSRDQ